MHNVEKEIKDLNRKLLKTTFKSEFKKKLTEKISFWNFIIDFTVIFLGLYLSDFISELLSINVWLVDMIVSAVIISFFRFLATIFFRKSKK